MKSPRLLPLPRHTQRLRLLFATVLALTTGCAGTIKTKVDFNTAEPLRIAVLPFAQVDRSGALLRSDESLLLDSIELVSSQLRQSPAEFVQSLVQTELSKAALDVIIPAIVEAELVHKGYTIPNSTPVQLDLSRIFALTPDTVCNKLLSCDAVLYGKVTRWSRSYYGVQTVSRVGIDLRLISAKTGRVLYEALADDSDSRGLTKGPTGLSSVVLEPLRGLDNDIVLDLARTVVSKAIAPLHAENRPEYLKTPPPAFIAAAHDATDGTLAPGGKLAVIALGTPGHTAVFSVGTRILDIPMVERRPGHYLGEFFPLESESFTDELVTVALKDGFGRTTTQTISTLPVSLRAQRRAGGTPSPTPLR